MSGERAAMQLAEANVALPRLALEDPEMAGFLRALDDVNWLADRSDGFVWRLRADDGPVVRGRLDGDDVVVTVSVWTDFDALQRYVYRSAHGLFMRRRARWFLPLRGLTTALWWVPEGERPGVDEGLARLTHLRAHGATPAAFSLRHRFDPDGVPVPR